MFALRRLVLAHRHLATLVCVAALAVKLLIPAGYMIASEKGRIAVTICSGVASQSMRMDMPGMGDLAGHRTSKEHGKTEMPCAFSGLSAQAIGAVDAVLVIAAIAFVMAVARRRVRSLARPITPYLRPPLRGPPVYL